MEIVGAMDLHRNQITFRWEDMRTGEVERGRIPALRQPVREWLGRFQGRDAHFALEGTTGWRYVVEELEAVGLTAHLADPAETHNRRGPKRRAKTDKADCELLAKLLIEERLPESWIPPRHMLDLRTLVRMRCALVEQRSQWQNRIHAQLFHQGLSKVNFKTAMARAMLAEAELSPAGQVLVKTGIAMIEFVDHQLEPLDRRLRLFSARQPGCRALQASLFGVGPVVSVALVAELGDCRRFSSSDDAVRHSGLDVTVYQSDGKRASGRISHQGPSVLRWALYEAAQSAARRNSPDHDYYLKIKSRIDHQRACLSVARKLCRRSFHILRALGDEAMAPVEGWLDESLLPASVAA